ncbi:protein turtle homolog B isoform X3 [Patella vulgata]|uniref:protein turtle homolog B isoform X3 n=1 Tax=Patella vulgata TaxID=6465 RepID=UPI0024A876BB|nr:protein turtle homolog B isoform X3 [Patella vulgata]
MESPFFLLLLLFLYGVPVLPQTTTPTTGGPYIMLSPRNMTAILGQRIQFSCGAEAYPNNITYYWFKDGIDVRTLSGFEAGRISISTDGSLLISSVVKGDMGWFLCRPSNGIGEDEAAAFLNVTYLPKVLPMPSQLTWARGFREKIDCPVDANPPMTDTIWTKDAQIVDRNNNRNILHNGTLVVFNASSGDSGSYSCTPVSLLGRGETSPQVQVFVRDPPYFTVRPPALYLKQTGETVSMLCKASGNPTPVVSWKKSKGQFERSDRIQINAGNLTIRNLVKEDHGFYECMATNDIATIVAVTEVRIMNTTPHAPDNVTVVTSLFSARVSWEPAYDGGSPQYYVLWFRYLSNDWSTWQTIQVPQNSMTFTLYALNPDTLYEFMVLSRNEYGDGMYSERVRAKTLGYVSDLVTALPTDQYGSTYIPDIQESIGPRPNPPRNVTIAMEENEVTVSWLPPANSSVPILYYVVEFRTDGNWQKYDGIVMASDRLLMKMSNLNRGTLYEIRVLSYGVLAYSLPSNIVTFNTTPASRTGRGNPASSSEPFRLPDALIGGIVGGLLFLLVAVLLAVIAVIHSKRKEQKAKVNRYNDVNYSKADETDLGIHQAPTKRDQWQSNVRRDIITGSNQESGVFVLPGTATMDTSRNRGSYLHDPRFYDRDQRTYNPTRGYGVADWADPVDMRHLAADRSLSRGSVKSRGQVPEFDTPDGRRPRPSLVDNVDVYPSPATAFRPVSISMQNPPSGRPSNQVYEGPYNSFHSDEEDDVFSPRALPVAAPRPNYPRHSSMKPAQMTYLTEEPPFSFNDMSSVMPSFSDRSRDPIPRYPSSQLGPRYQDPSPHNMDGPSSPSLSDPQVSWLPPSQQPPAHPPPQDDQNSSNSSGRPLGYTRDHLQGVVDRLRSTPRSPYSTSPTRNHDDNGFLDPARSTSPRPVPTARATSPISSFNKPRAAPYYTSDLEPYDERDHSRSQPRLFAPKNVRPRDESVPDSTSSGIGSRNTSQSTGSYPHRMGKGSLSFSSLLTPQEDLSQDSSPFLDGSSNHRRDTSGDENYEFDSINALENDILNALRNYSQLSAPGKDVTNPYPKPRRLNRSHDDNEQRFDRLREEFKKYRQRQTEPSLNTNPAPVQYGMDSEML